MNQNSATRTDFEMKTMAELEALYRTALCVLGNEADAEEVVQDTYANAYRSWLMSQDCPDCRLWLFRIMANALITKCNSLGDGSQATSNGADVAGDEARARKLDEQLLEGSHRAPLAHVAEGDVKQAICELPDPCRLIVILSLQEGFSYREIADITGIQLEAVKSRLHQGRRLIIERLSIRWPAIATAV